MDFIDSYISSYFYISVRIFAIIISAPFFNASTIPIKIKIAFVILLSFIISTQLTEMPKGDVFSIVSFITLVNQFLIGIAIGLLLQFTFQIVTFAGQLIALQCGLGYASLVDPYTNTTMPMLGQFYLLSTTIIFVTLNGHLTIIKLLMDSFTIMPVGVTWNVDNFYQVAIFSAEIFAGGVSIALPAIIALLTLNLTFAVINRSAPQFNIMSVGFSFILLIGLCIIAISIPSMLNHTESLFTHAFLQIKTTLG